MTRTSKFCFKTSLTFDFIRLFYLDVQSILVKWLIYIYTQKDLKLRVDQESVTIRQSFAMSTKMWMYNLIKTIVHMNNLTMANCISKVDSRPV